MAIHHQGAETAPSRKAADACELSRDRRSHRRRSVLSPVHQVPIKTFRTRSAQRSSQPNCSNTAVASVVMPRATTVRTSRVFRSNLSATAPNGMPKIRLGACRRPIARPTMKVESVSSRTSHPSTTISPRNVTPPTTAEALNARKSGNDMARTAPTL